MTKTNKNDDTSSKYNKTLIASLVGWVIILTALVFAAGAYVGNKYSDNRAKQVHSQVTSLANSVKK